MAEYELKKLSDLKVVELKHELEKRGLDKSGVKQFLMESLREALQREGKDPTTHLFEVVDKKAKRTSITNKEEKSDKTPDNKSEKENSQAVPANVESEKEKQREKEPEKDEDTSKNASVQEDKEETTEEISKDNGNEKQEVIDLDADGQDESIRLTLEDEETLHDDETENTENISPEKTSESHNEEDKNVNKEDTTATSEAEVDNSTTTSITTTTSTSTTTTTTTTTQDEANSKENKDSSSSGPGNTVTERVRKVSSNSNPKVVWISNITQNTRANELKKALSVCGKVNGAKIVVNARYPGSCCFGYVTMASVEDVENVISKLNNTELNGQIIKIEKFDDVRAEQMKQMRNSRSRTDDDKMNKSSSQSSTSNSQKSPEKDKKDEKNKTNNTNSSPTKRDDEKTRTDSEKKVERKDSTSKDEKKDNGRKSDTTKDKKDSISGSRSLERRTSRTSDSSRDRRGTESREKEKEKEKKQPIIVHSRTRHHPDLLTFDKIREERERQRLREKERLLREESRRRHEEALRQREVERRQRSEAARLEREREKLRQERDKIEKEKAELIRMERERTRLEREKLAAEKMELERTLIRLEEDRRAAKRPAPYSSRREDNYEDRKRPATGERHFDETPPPPPRFEPPPSVKSREPSPKKFSSAKDYKSRIGFESKHDSSYSDKRGGSGSGRDYPVERPIGRGSSGNKYDRSFDRDRSDPRGREVQSSRSKDRYLERERERERERSPHFRSTRDEERSSGRRTIAETKAAEMNALVREQHRYSDSSNGKESGRFDRSSSNWSGIQSSTPKSFGGSSNPKPWSKDGWRSESSNSERWSSSGPSGRSLSQSFSTNSNSNIAPICPPPPGINNYTDRFENNKYIGSSGFKKNY